MAKTDEQIYAEAMQMAGELGAACGRSMRQLAIDAGATPDEAAQLCRFEVYLCDGYGKVFKRYGTPDKQ